MPETVPLSFAERERLAQKSFDEIIAPSTGDETRQKKFVLTPRELEIVSAVVSEIAEHLKVTLFEDSRRLAWQQNID